MIKSEFFDDEIEYAIELNKIYDKEGFQGIIEYIMGELTYGNVSFRNGLYCITTGGWSEDEFLLDSLISPVSKMRYHYCGHVVGGAFYFSENKEVSVKLVVE